MVVFFGEIVMSAKGKIILQYIAAFFCFMFALVESGIISSLLLILSGFLFLPIKQIREILFKKLKLRGLFVCIIAGVLFLCAVMVSSDETENSSIDNTYSSEIISEADSLNEISSEEIVESSEEEYSSEEIVESSEEESSSEEIVESSEEEIFSEEVIESSEEEFHLTYILNTNSHKIHYPSCWQADKISEANKAETDKTLEELLEEGYDTCKTCFK